MATLSEAFFARPTTQISRDLIGKFLVREHEGKQMALMITETEAYDGFDDLASHARRGKTVRNAPMYGEPGTIYVYFTYGMHWMLNIVCGKAEYPAAVLIRGTRDIVGPARLTKALEIDKSLSGLKLSKKSGLWIEDRGISIPKSKIIATPRIGIAYAGSIWSQKPWRFVYVARQQKPISKKNLKNKARTQR